MSDSEKEGVGAAAKGKGPNHKGYKVKVNGNQIIFAESSPTGREVLTRAELTPPEDYTLRVKVAGEKLRKVELDEKVDLTSPGVEKFKALPRDQTEG